MRTGPTFFATAAAAVLAAALLAGCADKPEAMVASAKEYLAKNDRNAAIIQLKNALQKNPDLAEARFLLGTASLEAGDIASAEKELRRATELGYPTEQVAPALARALVAKGEYKKVVDDFAKTDIASAEGKATLQTSLGDAWLALGKTDAARAAYAAALVAVPGYAPAQLAEARLKAGAGDLAGGMAQVDAALAKSPRSVEGWQLKGDIATAQGAVDDALVAYRKALEVRPDHLPAHLALVIALARQGKNDEAAKQLEALKKVAPKHPQTLYLQALIAFREKKFTEARESVQQQLRTSPDNLLGLMLSSSIEFQLGAYAQAERDALKVLQRAPRQKFARMVLVNTYLRSGQLAKAADAVKPLLEDGEADSDVLALAGEVAMRQGDVEDAKRHFAKAKELDPKNTGKQTALALSHLAGGESARGMRELEEAAAADTGIRAELALILANAQQRKFDAALAAVDAVEKKVPDKPLAHTLRGAVLTAKGDRAGARKSFEAAAAMDPADFGAAASLARLDLAEKKPADAKKRFETLLAKDPKNARAWLALAELAAREGGSKDDVAALIAKGVAADPTNPGPRLALVSHYLRAKDPKKAAAVAQEAMAAIPDRPELLLAAAQAQQAAGETNQAVATYNKLAQLRPGTPMPYMRMAEVQLAAKDTDGALQSLRKALAIKPDAVEVQRAIVSIQVQAGRTKDALATAREFQKQRPKDPGGYAFEGDVHASAKAWNEALAAYRNGLRATDHPDLAIRIDAALRASGNAAEADKLAAAWAKDHPKDVAFRAYVAQGKLNKKDLPGAARDYKAILELQPDNVLALNNLAWIAGELKDPKAIEYAEKAHALAPGNAAVLDTLGVLVVAKGDVKRGVDLLTQAVALAPNAAMIRLNLARALVKDGQKGAAKQELETLAKLGDKFPGQPEVAKLMKEL